MLGGEEVVGGKDEAPRLGRASGHWFSNIFCCRGGRGFVEEELPCWEVLHACLAEGEALAVWRVAAGRPSRVHGEPAG